MSRRVAFAALAVALAAAALAPADASACTTFRIRSKDGAILVGRSMELGMPLQSAVMIVPRGFSLSATRPDQKPGTTWVAKYGFAGMNTLGVDISTDGLNEAGLSVGTLYIPEFVQYQPFPAEAGAGRRLEPGAVELAPLPASRPWVKCARRFRRSSCTTWSWRRPARSRSTGPSPTRRAAPSSSSTWAASCGSTRTRSARSPTRPTSSGTRRTCATTWT